MIWYNRKTKEEEDLTNASIKSLDEKLGITLRRIDEHKEKIERLRKIKREIIKLMEQKGTIVVNPEELPDIFIYNSNFYNVPALEKKGIDLHDAISKGKIIKIT